MGEHHGFLFFDHIPLISQLPSALAHSLLVAGLLIGASLVLRGRLKKLDDHVVPSEKATLQNVFEVLLTWLLNLLSQVIGKNNGPSFLPLIGTVFVFIFVSNLLGLIPGLMPPTSDMNTTLGLAIVVVIAFHFYGFKIQGRHYLKHFIGPVWWLSWMFIVLEFVGLVLVRPLSLSLRLFGNMTGDHQILSVFSDLVPLVVPVVFMVLGVFVSFIQALVFSLLTMVYIGGAITGHHAEAGHHH